MVKKLSIILSFIFVFFCLILPIYASSKYVILTDSVNIRKGPATSYDVYITAKLGSKYYLNNDNLVADEKNDGSCDNGWYEINYNGSNAYVCSEYVKVYDSSAPDVTTPTTDCETQLANLGFTSGYYKSLCELKNKYPNWNFEPIKTGLDFNVVVTQETKCGKSYIETNDPNYQDSSCKSIYSSTSIWKPASTGVVRYYLDPRNFLDEKNIFAFETLSYNTNMQDAYVPGVSLVLSNAAFYQYHLQIGNNLSEIMNSVGSELNVSPVFIASRIYQEMGASNKLYNLYSGVYPGYEGYYNFYNYGVTDSCANTSGTTICGLSSAKNNNWYGLNAAIKGGVTSISENYINRNQNTRYLQKFNVNPKDPNNIYNHQYMTNIRAPYGEASTAYNSYKNASALNNTINFSIPIYENMPAVTMLPTNLDDNYNDGADNTTPSAPTTPTPSTFSPNIIITSSGYKLNNNVITGINPNTSVSDFINALEGVGGKGCVTIKNAKGAVVTSGNIGTNFEVIVSGSETKSYQALIYGDASEDGNITALDLLLVQRHLLNTEILTGLKYQAIDPNKDGKVTALDLLLVQRHILKTESIKQ